MIRSFADKETASFFRSGKSWRLPPDIQRRAVMRLTQLDAATAVEDLRLPPSNRLEALTGNRQSAIGNRQSAIGNRQGQWSIRITNAGACVFALPPARRTTSRSSITTEEPS